MTLGRTGVLARPADLLLSTTPHAAYVTAITTSWDYPVRIGVVVLLASLLAVPSAAQDRWQLSLNNDRYLWDLQLVRLDRATLVVRQSDTTIAVPVRDITELRLVGKSLKRVGSGDGGRAVLGALMGVDDQVYPLTQEALEDRLAVIRNILRKHPPAGP